MEVYNENSKQKDMENVQFIKERNVNVAVTVVDIVGADRQVSVYKCKRFATLDRNISLCTEPEGNVV